VAGQVVHPQRWEGCGGAVAAAAPGAAVLEQARGPAGTG